MCLETGTKCQVWVPQNVILMILYSLVSNSRSIARNMGAKLHTKREMAGQLSSSVFVCLVSYVSDNIANSEIDHTVWMGRDSSVAIATRYGIHCSVIESPVGPRFLAPVQTGPGAHPATCTMGIASFPG